MKPFLPMLLCGLLCSCREEDDGTRPVIVPTGTKPEVAVSRFHVESQGKFQAGYDNNVREILIITDTSTKKKYLGITGVGITELRTEGTNNVTVER